jgi:hypothetical protein
MVVLELSLASAKYHYQLMLSRCFGLTFRSLTMMLGQVEIDALATLSY